MGARRLAALPGALMVIALAVGLFGATVITLPKVDGDTAARRVTSANDRHPDGFLTGQPRHPRPAGNRRVRLPNLTQEDLIAAKRLRVDVNGFRGGRVHVRAFVTTSNGKGQRVGDAVARLKGGRAAVTVPLSGPGLATLDSCRRRRIVVRAWPAPKKGRGEVRVSGALFTHPPTCAQFFPADSVWNTPLPRNLPRDPASGPLVAQLVAQYKRFGATINTRNYSTPIYTVPGSQRRAPVVVDRSEPYAAAVKAVLARGVPVPANAQPGGGNDGQMVIWQPATDTMWELYQAHNVNGVWHSRWGARMDHVSTSRGFFERDDRGRVFSTTASGLPLTGGLITFADLARRRIDHALAVAIPEARASFYALPARRTDGKGRGPDTVPEGARFRLPPHLDIAAMHLPPLVAMMARAAQRYGIIVHDQSGAMSFAGQDPITERTNPWRAANGGVSPIESLKAFPWDRLELTAMTVVSRTTRPRFSAAEQRRPRCRLIGIPCSG
jgi:hypothetical protein